VKDIVRNHKHHPNAKDSNIGGEAHASNQPPHTAEPHEAIDIEFDLKKTIEENRQEQNQKRLQSEQDNYQDQLNNSLNHLHNAQEEPDNMQSLPQNTSELFPDKNPQHFTERVTQDRLPGNLNSLPVHKEQQAPRQPSTATAPNQNNEDQDQNNKDQHATRQHITQQLEPPRQLPTVTVLTPEDTANETTKSLQPLDINKQKDKGSKGDSDTNNKETDQALKAVLPQKHARCNKITEPPTDVHAARDLINKRATQYRQLTLKLKSSQRYRAH
jgi:hypothetical protein